MPETWIFLGQSWLTHLDLGRVLHDENATNRWEAYVSVKFDGPAYGGDAAENQVLVDRIVLVAPAPDCPADLDGDGIVGGSDLGQLLLRWNDADPAADLDGDGVVSGPDLGIMLLAWGACG